MTDTSVDDFLAHHGVLGMKWGHHKAQGGGSSSSARKAGAAHVDKANEVKTDTKKKVTSQDIKDARARQAERADKVNQHAIDYLNQTSDVGRARAEKILQRSNDKLINNPDAAIANRMTAGEKFWSGAGASLIAVSAAALAVDLAKTKL